MGKPNITGFQMVLRRDECIVPFERTQGTDTSQYLEEKKSTETPSVAASEGGYSPNQASAWGCGSREELQRRC